VPTLNNINSKKCSAFVLGLGSPATLPGLTDPDDKATAIFETSIYWLTQRQHPRRYESSCTYMFKNDCIARLVDWWDFKEGRVRIIFLHEKSLRMSESFSSLV
jgi:hypothetical protein